MQLESRQHRFTPDPDTVHEDVFCGVCGAKTLVTRNVHGPRNYVQAMSGSAEYYDMFLCPHFDSGWHIKAIELRQKADESASDWFRGMINAEADYLIQANVGH